MTRQNTNKNGNIIAARIPNFILSFSASEINPTRVGPLEHPKSPARAISANMAVPPGISLAAKLSVPGHMIPTANPHSAHPMSPIIGEEDREIIK